MAKQNFIYRIYQNARKPEGFIGRLILKGMNCGHKPVADWAMSHLQWQPQWQILDIGCGGGANIARMLKRCPQGKVYGLDYSAVSVVSASRKNKKWLGERCFVEQGNVEKQPYRSGQFDVVTAFETIYFWQNVPRALSEVGRVLKAGGLFMICCEACDPANTTWSSRIDGMVIRTADELKVLLEESGFSDIEVYMENKEWLCVVAKANPKRKEDKR